MFRERRRRMQAASRKAKVQLHEIKQAYAFNPTLTNDHCISANGSSDVNQSVHNENTDSLPEKVQNNSSEFASNDFWNFVNEGAVEFSLESEEEESPQVLVKDLAVWQTENAIPKRSMTKLLRILRKHGLNVPADARTVLQTPPSGTIAIHPKSGEQRWKLHYFFFLTGR